jgi:hypothetical protein
VPSVFIRGKVFSLLTASCYFRVDSRLILIRVHLRKSAADRF